MGSGYGSRSYAADNYDPLRQSNRMYDSRLTNPNYGYAEGTSENFSKDGFVEKFLTYFKSLDYLPSDSSYGPSMQPMQPAMPVDPRPRKQMMETDMLAANMPGVNGTSQLFD